MRAITLKAARTNAGLTQAQAAQMIGVSTATIIKYERGDIIPSGKRWSALCLLYDYPMASLTTVPRRDGKHMVPAIAIRGGEGEEPAA